MRRSGPQPGQKGERTMSFFKYATIRENGEPGQHVMTALALAGELSGEARDLLGKTIRTLEKELEEHQKIEAWTGLTDSRRAKAFHALALLRLAHDELY
jgi:uncharacterized protein YvpB